MPLDKSGSKKAVGKNIKTEMAAGKPQKQAVAIALNTQRRAEHGDVVGVHRDGRALIHTPHGSIPVPIHALDRAQVVDYAKHLHSKAQMADGGVADQTQPAYTDDQGTQYYPGASQGVPPAYIRPLAKLLGNSNRPGDEPLITTGTPSLTQDPDASVAPSTPAQAQQADTLPITSNQPTLLEPGAEALLGEPDESDEKDLRRSKTGDLAISTGTESPEVRSEAADIEHPTLAEEEQLNQGQADADAARAENLDALASAKGGDDLDMVRNQVERSRYLIDNADANTDKAELADSIREYNQWKALLDRLEAKGNSSNDVKTSPARGGGSSLLSIAQRLMLQATPGAAQPQSNLPDDIQGMAPDDDMDANLAKGKQLVEQAKGGSPQQNLERAKSLLDPQAAVDAGVAPGYAKAVAQVESAGGKLLKNPNPGSTASGLYGFTAPTANYIDNKFGLDPSDPDIETKRLGALTAENAKILKTQDPVELYAAHNSGAHAVLAAKKSAAEAGEPDNWVDYLVTPVGKGNKDPLQGQKAVKKFQSALANAGSTQNQDQDQADALPQAQQPQQSQPAQASPPGNMVEQQQPEDMQAEPLTSDEGPTLGQMAMNAIQHPSNSGSLINMGIAPNGQSIGALPPNQPFPNGQMPQPAPARVADAAVQAVTRPQQTQAGMPQQQMPQQQQGQQLPPGVLYSPEQAARSVQNGLNQQISAVGSQGAAEAAGQMALSNELGGQSVLNRQLYQDQQAHEQQLRASLMDMQQKSQNIIDRVANDRVDPNRWWSSRNAGQKVAGIAGILLSGLSGSDHNAALDAINSNINRDIEAQKVNLSNLKGASGEQLNLYGKMLDLYRSEPAAQAATQAALLRQFQDRIGAIAAKYNSPAVAAKAAQIQAQLGMQAASLTGAAAVNAAQTAQQLYLQSGTQKLYGGMPQAMGPGERSAVIQNAAQNKRLEYVGGEPVIVSEPLTEQDRTSIEDANDIDRNVSELSALSSTFGNRTRAQSISSYVRGRLEKSGISKEDIDDALTASPTTPGRPFSGQAQALHSIAASLRQRPFATRNAIPVSSMYNSAPDIKKIQ